MAKSLVSDRIKFSKNGDQRSFIIHTKENIGLSWNALSDLLGISQKTLRDWADEKFHMSYLAAGKLAKLSGVKIPNDFVITKWGDHLKSISRQGGMERYRKYQSIGDEKNRLRAWRKWWEDYGKFQKNNIFNRKKIILPKKSNLLSEFVGIMIGDGGISDYKVVVTLHSKDDRQYCLYVKELMHRLFKTDVRVYNRKNSKAIDIVIHGADIVDFCRSIGLKKGNKLKQGLDIPEWIKRDDAYYKYCIRGLFDTDGSVFRHSYYSKKKKYCYLKIGFTSASKKLLESVCGMLRDMDISASISDVSKDVRISCQTDVKRYIKLVGTNNPKHKVKYKYIRKYGRVTERLKVAPC